MCGWTLNDGYKNVSWCAKTYRCNFVMLQNLLKYVDGHIVLSALFCRQCFDVLVFDVLRNEKEKQEQKQWHNESPWRYLVLAGFFSSFWLKRTSSAFSGNTEMDVSNWCSLSLWFNARIRFMVYGFFSAAQFSIFISTNFNLIGKYSIQSIDEGKKNTHTKFNVINMALITLCRTKDKHAPQWKIQFDTNSDCSVVTWISVGFSSSRTCAFSQNCWAFGIECTVTMMQATTTTNASVVVVFECHFTCYELACRTRALFLSPSFSHNLKNQMQTSIRGWVCLKFILQSLFIRRKYPETQHTARRLSKTVYTFESENPIHSHWAKNEAKNCR